MTQIETVQVRTFAPVSTLVMAGSGRNVGGGWARLRRRDSAQVCLHLLSSVESLRIRLTMFCL